MTVNNIVNGIAFSKINLSKLKEVQDVEGLKLLNIMLDNMLAQREGGSTIKDTINQAFVFVRQSAV
ncbi:hypothetical protein [Borrelia hermsii]|uniref:Variable large protein n=1 Tax=Borrelia hermsii HS1 TaxID=1867252 RepID=A0ABM6AQU1_BORHE|nr:hypothetical protein [Borrelia hermsii]ANA43683.1 hypothetical protein AXX13_A0195 [Borrelia hermsii HS1]UCP01910.1 hypothetical protein K9R62_04555 [Borrelia hermsii]